CKVHRTASTRTMSLTSDDPMAGRPHRPESVVQAKAQASARIKTPDAARRTFVVRLSASNVNCPMATCNSSTQYAPIRLMATATPHQNSGESNTKICDHQLTIIIDMANATRSPASIASVKNTCQLRSLPKVLAVSPIIDSASDQSSEATSTVAIVGTSMPLSNLANAMNGVMAE